VAGNGGQTAHYAVQIDTAAPVTTNNSDANPHQVFSLVFSPGDVTSGVASTSYRVDGGGWQSGTSVQLRVSIRHKRAGLARGVHTIEYTSTDLAGNVETTGTCTVTLGP